MIILEEVIAGMTEKELVDKIILAESDEDYDESARLLGEIAKAYGYTVELTGDGNWNLSGTPFKIEVMFDSSRGGEIPIDFDEGEKTLKTEFIDPAGPGVRKIVMMCIEFMKEHKNSP